MNAAPPLTRRFKATFAIGSMAEAIVISTTTQFLLIFYNQVRGAPAGLVGLALSAGLVLNAFWDPVVGSWSDRTRTRLGRRHPFMFAAIVPVGLSFYALFNPPEQLSQTALLVWLCVGNIMLQQALAVFHTPHLALGGELSDRYLERSNVMAYNTFFLWVGDTLCWLLTFGWFFRPSPGFPNGALDASRWPNFSLIVAMTAFVILSVSAWFTRSRIKYLPKTAPDAKGFGAVEFVRDLGRALSNRNYVMLLIGYFFLSLMMGVRGGLWIYGATYFWQLANDQIVYFVFGSLAGYVFGSAIVTHLHRRFEKRWTAAGAAALYCIGPAIPLALGYLGVLGPQTPGLLVILICFSVLQHVPFCIMTTTVYSALADIADENEVKFGLRQEGVLFATRTFFARVDQAIGAALAGWVLTLIAFPKNAVPGEVPEPVLMGLAAAWVLSTLPGLGAAIFYAHLNVTRATHATARAVLDQRRAVAAD